FADHHPICHFGWSFSKTMCGHKVTISSLPVARVVESGGKTMSIWNDPGRWAALCSCEACPICSRGEPLDIVATLDSSWVTMQEAAPVRGYVCLVSRIHAVELHDLPEAAAIGFMQDAQRVSKALCEATAAVKLNYEIHGNSLPHLHMHFFPRYRGDRFEGKPIDPKSVLGPVYAEGEFQRIRDAFRFSLDLTTKEI